LAALHSGTEGGAVAPIHWMPTANKLEEEDEADEEEAQL